VSVYGWQTIPEDQTTLAGILRALGLLGVLRVGAPRGAPLPSPFSEFTFWG